MPCGVETGASPPDVSANAFKAVCINVHQFVGFEQRFDLRPLTGEQGVIFISAEITESQMNDPWWGRFRDDPIGKIRILADNDQVVFAGKFPYL